MTHNRSDVVPFLFTKSFHASIKTSFSVLWPSTLFLTILACFLDDVHGVAHKGTENGMSSVAYKMDVLMSCAFYFQLVGRFPLA